MVQSGRRKEALAAERDDRGLDRVVALGFQRWNHLEIRKKNRALRKVAEFNAEQLNQ